MEGNKATLLHLLCLWSVLSVTITADSAASSASSTQAASPSAQAAVTLSAKQATLASSSTPGAAQATTNKAVTPAKIQPSIFSVINEVTSNKTLSNDTLSYLVNIVGDTSSTTHAMLPTILSLAPQTSIALMEKVLDHPAYASLMVDSIAADPVLARILLKPLFESPDTIKSCLGKTLKSPELTVKLVKFLVASPTIAANALEGLKFSVHNSTDLLPSLVHEILANPRTLDAIITNIIGKDMGVVDSALEVFANLSIPGSSIIGPLISNIQGIFPAVKVILRNPILPNYLFSLFLQNQALTNNAQTILLSSAGMIKSVLEGLTKDPELAEEVLGLSLQHPKFTNGIIAKVMGQPELVINLIAAEIKSSPLGKTFLGQLFDSNLPTVINLVKFVLGQNSSVQIPPIFIPSAILNAFNGTTIGDYLNDIHSGNIKTFADFLAVIKGIFANIAQLQSVAPEILEKLIASSPLKDTFVARFLPTIVNVVKFFQGQNSTINIPKIAIPQVLLSAFAGTSIGNYLEDINSGKVKTFADIVRIVAGVISHPNEITSVVTSLLSKTAQSISLDECAMDAIASAKGLLNVEQWALKFIDASGKPQRGLLKGNLVFMGNYDECMEIDQPVGASGHRIQGGYCELSFPIPAEFYKSIASDAQSIESAPADIRLDLCLPKSCKARQINSIVNTSLVTLLGGGLSHLKCIEDKSIEGNTGAYVAIAIFAILIFLCFIGTLYDVVRRLRKPSDGEGYELPIRDSEKNGHVGPGIALTKFVEDGVIKTVNGDSVVGDADNEQPHPEPSRQKDSPEPGNRFLMAFSIRENGSKILNASQPKGSMTCLNGIRVLSMSWIILGHILTTYGDTVENPTEALEFIKKFYFQPLINAPLGVDTFFFLSGMLVSYLFVKEVSKTKRIRCGQMFLYYFHRFWRLTPLYMLVLLFFGFLSPYLASGPLDKETVIYRDNCKTYWWRNILYINVLFPENEMCMLWSWYLSDDMIFYVVAPLAIIPLALGYVVIGFLVIVLMFITHVATYGYFEWYIGGGSQLWHNTDYMNYVYLKPWSRVGVYAIGLALGYILFKTKAKYRFRRFTLLIGWFLAFFVGLTIVYVTYLAHETTEHLRWPLEARISHETIYRPAWAFCLAWVVFTCVNGQGGFINTILSWSFWVPLTKLTYGAYLLHLMFIDNILDSNKRAPGYLDILYVGIEFIGVFAFSYVGSFFFSLLGEAPFMALEKILIKKKK